LLFWLLAGLVAGLAPGGGSPLGAALFAIAYAADFDGDGVEDAADCAPSDPHLSAPHTFFFDRDFDQFGNAAESVALCQTRPFPGTVIWHDDPDDTDPAQIGPIVPKGGRILAVDFRDTAEDGTWPATLARELGAQATPLDVSWDSIETSPGVFDGQASPALTLLRQAYADQGFAVSLTVSVIAGRTLPIPPDLAAQLHAGTVTLADPAVIARFNAVLDFVHSRLGALPLTSLQLGHEVDRYVEVDATPEFWSSFATFYFLVAEHARTLWGPGLEVGLTATRAGLVSGPAATLMEQLNGLSDVVSVTYFPRQADFAVDPGHLAAGVRTDIDALVAKYPRKPIHFQAVGFPSSPAARSSTTVQSQFLYAFFSAWDAHRERIPFASFGPLHDLSPARALEATADPARGLPVELASPAAEYFRSLGLRTYPGAGSEKPAFHTLRTLTIERGWWRVAKATHRSFRLGLSSHPYDHVPGQLQMDSVLDGIYAHVEANADLVLHHFDNGVPWPDALFDTFSSAVPPYGAELMNVWSRRRARRPAGVGVIVAINPLGVPRGLLASYWGFGEGYFNDFGADPSGKTLTGTGTFQDYEFRLLPPPWNTFRFDAPEVKQAYVNYARRIIEYFHPEYVVLGVEVNNLLNEPDSVFDQYVGLQAYVYTTLRADPAYANVKFVVSITAEELIEDEIGSPMTIAGVSAPNEKQRELAALSRLLPYTDVVGLALYPAKLKYDTNRLPAVTFRNLLAAVRSVTDKPIAITETGYPARSFNVAGHPYTSDPDKQARFFKLMFSELERDGNIEFVVNFGARDFAVYLGALHERAKENPPFIAESLVDFFDIFESTGVYAFDGSARAGTAVWVDEFERPVQRSAPWVRQIDLANPDGALTTRIGVDEAGRMYYSAALAGTTVLDASPLGVTVNGEDLGAGVVNLKAGPTTDTIDPYLTRGNHGLALNRYRLVRVTARRASTTEPAFEVEFRVYDDGIAYRYVIPGSGPRTVTGEASAWRFPRGTRIWYQNNTGHYESGFETAEIGSFEESIGGPFTVRLPGRAAYVTVTEANGVNYSGMTYRSEFTRQEISATFLDDAQWTVQGGSTSPWRACIISADLNGLVNTDMVTNLNPAPDPALFPAGELTPWIKPGRALWSWWSDFFSPADFGVQAFYVEAAHALGFEYVVVDRGWELGFPIPGKDPFDRLAELVDFAHSAGRNVGIWVWKKWAEVQDPVQRADFFRKVKAAGAVGIKFDNLSSADNDSVADLRLSESISRELAALGLMLNFHGTAKPTGRRRSYPNQITHEGLAGLENNALWEFGFFLPPEHNATLPFTRFVAGPGDYTPVTFDPRKLGNTTFTHQLATAGVFTSPLQHFAEDPALLLSQPLVRDILADLPTVWDETVVLPASEIGKLVMFARRQGERWYLFVLNGESGVAKTVPGVDLSFLGAPSYDAVLISDAARDRFQRRERLAVDAQFPLDITLLPGGGFVSVFVPSTR